MEDSLTRGVSLKKKHPAVTSELFRIIETFQVVVCQAAVMC